MAARGRHKKEIREREKGHCPGTGELGSRCRRKRMTTSRLLPNSRKEKKEVRHFSQRGIKEKSDHDKSTEKRRKEHPSVLKKHDEKVGYGQSGRT